MIFKTTKLDGAYIIEPERLSDDRGFFARVWCQDEFAKHGLETTMLQSNISYNRRRGTLRGMHFQRPPHAEVKIVRCTAGAVYDVIIDLRQGSPTFTEWIGVDLSAENRRMLYVPHGFAHGYITRTDDAEVLYQVSASYAPEAEGGVRYDDPAFGIEWPVSVEMLSDKDASWSDFQSTAALKVGADVAAGFTKATSN